MSAGVFGNKKSHNNSKPVLMCGMFFLQNSNLGGINNFKHLSEKLKVQDIAKNMSKC